MSETTAEPVTQTSFWMDILATQVPMLEVDLLTVLTWFGSLLVTLIAAAAAIWAANFIRTRSGGILRRRRIGVLEVTAVDGKRRLVLMSWDNREILIMTGGPTDVMLGWSEIRSTPSGGAVHGSRTEAKTAVPAKTNAPAGEGVREAPPRRPAAEVVPHKAAAAPRRVA